MRNALLSSIGLDKTFLQQDSRTLTGTICPSVAKEDGTTKICEEGGKLFGDTTIW